MLRHPRFYLGALLALWLPMAAQAEEPDRSTQESTIPTEAEAKSGLPNVAVELGAGLQTFSGQIGDVLQGGIGYSGRIIVGARSRFGVELGYLGAWNEAERTQTLDKTAANVYANSEELLGRVNFGGTRALVKPFLAAGASYLHFNAAISTPIGGLDLRDRDLIGMPLVAGLQLLPGTEFTVSLRGNYTLLTDWIDRNVASGNEWGAMASAGAVF